MHGEDISSRPVFGGVAADLGVGSRELAELIRSSFDERTRGQLGDLRETSRRRHLRTLRYSCSQRVQR